MRSFASPIAAACLSLFSLAALSACAVTDLVDQSTPPTQDSQPDIINSADGAMAAYRGAVLLFTKTFAGQGDVPYVIASGMLTDELSASKVRIGDFNGMSSLDERLLPNDNGTPQGADRLSVSTAVYKALQHVRGRTHETSGALRRYAPGAPALVGHLYALEAYAELMLADFFCSGVPLSTLDFGENYTYKPGSSRAEVYQHAIALFDTAMTLAHDSATIVNLARVGRGRAYLALGDFPKAAAAVHDVPNGFVYWARYSAQPSGAANYFQIKEGGSGMDEVTVNDVEGENGLDYVSAQDPRVPTSTPEGSRGVYPDKYAPAGNTPIPVASFVEARLIEAEAALNADDASWLTTLNALRTDGTFTTQPDPDNPTAVDTTWGVGTGAPLLAFTLPGLRPLDDPIDPDARVNLLFRERAFWLFLTGQRQSDLRRLVAVYHRRVDDAYPVGSYSGGTGLYGTDVNAPVPIDEVYYNPRYSGCINRGA